MSRYDEVRALVAANKAIAEFADFGDGVSEEWILRAESALGVRLPPSYRWWLRNYGGGEIGGEEIYSVYEQDFETVVGGDIVAMQRVNEVNGLLTGSQLEICHSDIDGVFYFDLETSAGDGEYPVVSAGTGEVYASCFLDFLEKRIRTFSEESPN